MSGGRGSCTVEPDVERTFQDRRISNPTGINGGNRMNNVANVQPHDEPVVTVATMNNTVSTVGPDTIIVKAETS